MYDDKKILARHNVFCGCIDLHIRSKSYDGVKKYAPRIRDEDFTEAEIGVVIDPTISIGLDAGQELMDQLWQCGLRPTEGKGSAGALAATENHLADLRKITFNLLDMENAKHD